MELLPTPVVNDMGRGKTLSGGMSGMIGVPCGKSLDVEVKAGVRVDGDSDE